MEHLFLPIVRNSLFSAIGKFSVKAISVVFTIFIIRWLGDEDYGRYVLIWSHITLFAMFSDAGLSMYAIREIAKKTANGPFISGNIIAIRFILASVTMIMLLATTSYLDDSENFLLQMLLASTILLLYAVQDPFDAILQAHERFDLATLSVIVGQMAFVLLGSLLLWSGWHITGLIIAALINVTVSAGLAGWFIMISCPIALSWRFEPTRWIGFIRAALPFGLIKLWLSWSTKIGIVILSWFWAEKMVGWYGAAHAIVLGFISLSNAINIALYPTLSRQYTQNPAKMPKLYEFTLKYLLLFTLPIAGATAITAESWVDLLYGAEFRASTAILEILIWIVPLTFVSEFFRYTLLATDRDRAAVRMLGVSVLFAIVLDIWLIPIYGVLAAAVIMTLAEVLLLFLYIYQLKYDLQTLNLVDVIVKPMLVTLILVLIVDIASPAGLIWQIVLGAASYAAAIWLLQVISPRECKLLFSLIKHPGQQHSVSSDRTKLAPLVSVFIPAYNAGQFLDQAIISVLNQTYKNYELIVIDDGSTDNTPQVLEQYRDHPLMTIYRNTKNKGMAPTWNIGLKLCRGELIAKLDADDFYEPTYLQTVVGVFQKRQEVGLVFSGLNLIYPDGRSEPEMISLNSWVRKRHIFLPSLLQLCSIRSPTVCVRRACYEQLGGFNPDMKIHADWEMWVRIAANYPVGFVARCLANYRMSYGLNCTAQAAIDGRSIADLQLWLHLLEDNALPYRLTAKEMNNFKRGIYELEMHFAGVAAYYERPEMQKTYVTFAEQVLGDQLLPQEMERMRQVHLNLHQGICAFQERRLGQARGYFLRAIRSGPGYCKPLWIWSKLLLTFLGKTKWGVMYR